MDMHERQQFDLLLELAAARFVERLEQRNEGAENALARLRENPDGEFIWIGQFVDALFQDFLLNSIDGAAFVLRAVPRRRVMVPSAGSVEAVLLAMAMSVFSDLLRQKTDEELERRIGYQAYSTASIG
jgi:3'-phosphoadenosine 5'-phosphosulfate sulfotransferase